MNTATRATRLSQMDYYWEIHGALWFMLEERDSYLRKFAFPRTYEQRALYVLYGEAPGQEIGRQFLAIARAHSPDWPLYALAYGEH